MCFAGERRSDRTSTIRIVFYLFGSIAGFRPSLRWLRLSGRRPSFAGTVLGFGRIGAGDPATVLGDRSSRLSCARSLGPHVPYESLVELRAAYMPDVARAVSGIP